MRALLVIAAAACSAAPHAPAQAHEPRVVINERAFARLYGTLRWFHPSDECAALDWDRFASYGVQRVRDAADTAALETTLRELVAPIAPTVRIGAHPDVVPPPAGDDLTWWEHLGPGMRGVEDVYGSKRHGIAALAHEETGFGGFAQTIAAEPYRGQRIRLRARARVHRPATAQLWLRVDRGKLPGFFQNMEKNPFKGTAWTPLEIVGTVDADGTDILFGSIVEGTSEAWFDDFTLEVERGGAWTPIAIHNGAFDRDLAGWYAVGGKWPMAVDAGAARVSAPEGHEVTDELFDEAPRRDEVTDVDLGDGLHARVPLVVARRDHHTIPAGAPLALPAELPQDVTWLADIVVAWNVYAQFSPYFDVNHEDWDRALDDFLRDALDDNTPADHLATLHRVVARLHDGHGYVLANEPLLVPPVRFGWVDDQVVVLASTDPRVHRGDVVLAVDGQPASARITQRMALESGSELWTREHALAWLARGDPGSVTLALANHTDVTLDRTSPQLPPIHDHAPLAEIEPGIWYVDLEHTDMASIDAAMDKLAAAAGVVFDMRGYPAGTHDVLRHVITKPDDKNWMHIPHIVRPRMRDIAGWSDMTWGLTPAEPHLANVVFLTDGTAVSYAESVMGYVAYEGLPIVGQPTAGANGNIVMVDLPGGEQISFTGMKVTRHDGGQQHLVGIPPTVRVAPTIAGIAAGRDEQLERAIALLRTRRPAASPPAPGAP